SPLAQDAVVKFSRSLALRRAAARRMCAPGARTLVCAALVGCASAAGSAVMPDATPKTQAARQVSASFDPVTLGPYLLMQGSGGRRAGRCRRGPRPRRAAAEHGAAEHGPAGRGGAGRLGARRAPAAAAQGRPAGGDRGPVRACTGSAPAS
ncbi:unnamed protein product, partial [Prorocentrum cordatum]